MANAPLPPFWTKQPDIAGVRAMLERLFDEGGRDELIAIVLAMLQEALSKNNELAWRLQSALKLLGRNKSERISKEQLALFFAKLTEQQAKLAETPAPPPADAPPPEPAEPPASPKRSRKKPFPDHLRREIVPVPVEPAQRTCDQCGTPKSPMGFDTQCIWEFKPAEFFIIEERLEKLVCKTCETGVVAASGSAKPLDRA